ncbi:MAG: kynureninase [Holophagales bacterium]|nr:kynureninase [Holophagales bacterium]
MSRAPNRPVASPDMLAGAQLDGLRLPIDRTDLEALDARDPLARFRDRFHLPEGLIYLDGNSLGPLPRAARQRLRRVVEEEWGEGLVGSWNAWDWIGLPSRVGAKIAPLVGAEAGEVVACDSVSVNLFKLLAAALRLRPGRRVILCPVGHFPTDLYIAEGLAALSGTDVEVRTAPADCLAEALDDSVAVLSAGHVDFRSGRLLPMESLTAAAHRSGALALWDLSHSAGALPVELGRLGVDLAVGCGYKFLAGGPGAPSFLFVARRHQEGAHNPLSGWMGHRRPFDFSPEYEPAQGVRRFVCGTPPILALAALDAALDLWSEVDLGLLRAKSYRLGQLFLALVEQEITAISAPAEGLPAACPLEPRDRGSQVGFHHSEAYAIVQALIARGIVGDFREPSILRFGLCPLFLRHVDIWDAVAGLREVLASGEYREERFHRRGIVT